MITDTERANLISERLAKDPKVQQIVADARVFGSLREHPGWQRLFSLTAAKRERWMGTVLARLMGPQKHWPSTEEIAYNQGFYQGAVFVLAHPEHAEASLERAASVAWAMSYDEEEEHAERE